jgi:hypothetical protein
MSTGFMDGHQANGAFVACGPPGFTALALLNLGARARQMYVFLLVITFGSIHKHADFLRMISSPKMLAKYFMLRRFWRP